MRLDPTVTTPLPAAPAPPIDAAKRAAGEAAAALVAPGMRLGLGTGSTADWATRAIGRRMADGELRDLVAVPTSDRTAALAGALGIPLATLAEVPSLDLAIDGADEIDPSLDLIKGLGAALLREKIVADAAARFVVVADGGKRVARLGTRSPLPVAVIPFAWQTHLAAMRALGAEPTLRIGADGEAVVTDDGLLILDCAFPDGIADPAGIETALRARPGVVATGLFLGMADVAFIAEADGVREVRRGR
jgi:ribose 5-phosphate isomerase A